MRELVYFIAVTLDGFIAGPGDQFDGFVYEGDHVAAIGEKYRGAVPTHLAESVGLATEGGPFDTVLMGWNTYSMGLPDAPSPYRHLRQVVFTRTHAAPAEAEGVEFTDRDPVEVVRELKAEEGGAIWLCGGAALAAQLVDEIDRLALKVHPVLFGSGIPVFGARPYAPERWHPLSTTAFTSGVTLAEYTRLAPKG
ncbi:dihydrofolate reductase family protein [Microbacterium sp. H1-D42]|uniref:dihydrofolate reductase family protein n=1 Tax=Microbacterium sp. H1-D42 TaxID=2925844 RepID=UPI001F5345E2|nr:dihydrofolate reductase family protein [Microbacterium sp. H1-D42]UNK71096.1 dihydrofolate reductase family protein [Microbacterium sp. H1-D42]